MTRRRRAAALGAAGIATAAVAVWALPQHPFVKERRLSHLTLSELTPLALKDRTDPQTLYWYGRRLNDAERYPLAADVLRTGVELDPDTARLRDEWARTLTAMGQPTPAFAALKQFVGTHPADPDGRFYLGKFYFSQRAMDKAAAELDEAVRLRPGFGEALSYLAGARDALGDKEKARDAARRAVAARPDDRVDQLMLASLEEQANDLSAARSHYERAAALETNGVGAHVALARFLRERGAPADAPRALDLVRRAALKEPGNAGALALLGRCLEESGDAAGAAKSLAAAVALAPDDRASLLSLRNLAQKRGDASEAARWDARYQAVQAEALEMGQTYEALRVTPRDAALNVKMARLEARRGEIAGCLRHFGAALRNTTDSAPVLLAGASALAEAGRPDDALPLARRALALAPSSAAANVAMGDAFLKKGWLQQAAGQYEIAAGWDEKLRPELKAKLKDAVAKRRRSPSEADRLLAEAMRQEGSLIGPAKIHDETVALIEKGLTLAPDSPMLLAYLQHLRTNRGETAAAIAAARKLLALVPEDGSGHAELAALLADGAATPAAFAEIEDHLARAENDPTAANLHAYAAGIYYLKRGDGKRAVGFLRRAVRLNPGAPTTLFKLAQAEKLAGNEAEAQVAMARYQRIQDGRRAEADVLDAVSQHPEKPEAYVRAARLFAEHGQPRQAESILSEARRRFGPRLDPLIKSQPERKSS